MPDSLDRTLKSLDAITDFRGMGTILPDNPQSQLRFFEQRAPGWVESAAQIGLSDLQAAEVAAATAVAAEAWTRARLARDAARNATLDWEFAAKRLRQVGGEAIKTIKAYAGMSGDALVYPAASIEPPNRPGPKHRSPGDADAALPRIRSCTASPNPRGGVDVEWTCGHGATKGAGFGMFYRVSRSIDGGEFALLEVVGSPGAGRRSVRFTDETVPTGTRLVEYSITPLRGTATGTPSNSATVYFGSGGAGEAEGCRSRRPAAPSASRPEP